MSNKNISILGAGESGVGAALLAMRKGYTPFVSDGGQILEKYKAILETEQIQWEENGHTQERILQAEEIIKSPGIPPTIPILQEAVKRSIPIVSEIEFAARYTAAKMICITGSNGKTTTTKLIYQIFKDAGFNVGLAGNVGKSLALQIAEGKRYDYYVLELSSFQLEDMYRFHAHIAILLNITPDHLDRYGYQMQPYVDAKMRITQNQTADDALVYWHGDNLIREELQKHALPCRQFPFTLQKEEGSMAYVEDGKIKFTNPITFNLEQEELALRGTHNLYNSMAAGIAASLAEIKSEDIRASLSSFQGVTHRMEQVGSIEGVTFVNDSKATNVNACWYALDSMQTPVVLILGGVDKGNDYSEIDELVRKKVKGLIFLGTDNSKLHAHFHDFDLPMYDSISMEDCVQKALSMSAKGDTVLLSPCCASFDLFENMADRGNQFKEVVRNLNSSSTPQ